MLLRRRAASIALLLAIGVGLVAYVYVQIYTPTVGAPNYWENNTGALVPLVLFTLLAGGILTSGFYLGVDRIALQAGRRFGPTAIRGTGLAALLGGILWSAGSLLPITRAIPATPVVSVGIDTGASGLLIAGMIGLYARYGNGPAARTRQGVTLVAAGLLISIIGTLLRHVVWYAPIRTGALGYPARVLDGVGLLVLLGGFLVVGVACWRRQVIPRWLGGVVIAAVIGFVCISVGKYAIRGLWRIEPMVGFGLVGVGIGYHLLDDPDSGAVSPE